MADKVELQEVPSLKSIGEALKKKREELSYTLEHVSEVTCITHSNLRNLEKGNLEELPGPVFVKGFIKNYARFLNIESDWMIDSLSADEYLVSNAPTEYNIVGSEFEAANSPNKPHNKYVVPGLILAALLLSVFWWSDNISSYFSSGKEGLETINAAQTEIEEQNKVINDSLADKGETKTDLAAEGETQANADQGDEIQKTLDIHKEEEPEADKRVISPLNLILVANESRWIRLAIDDEKPFEVLLKKGERYNWAAQKEYSLIMSSGGVASVHLNGEEILDREKFMNQLYQAKLNKFTLKQINNR